MRISTSICSLMAARYGLDRPAGTWFALAVLRAVLEGEGLSGQTLRAGTSAQDQTPRAAAISARTCCNRSCAAVRAATRSVLSAADTLTCR